MALSADTANKVQTSAKATVSSGIAAPDATTQWLQWLSEKMPSCTWFVLVSGPQFKLESQWPSKDALPQGLASVALRALKRSDTRQSPLPGDNAGEALVVPIQTTNNKPLVLLFDSQQLSNKQKQACVKLVAWASHWLLAAMQTPASSQLSAAALAPVVLSQKMIADFDQHGSVESVAMMLVNSVATLPDIYRVSVAEVTGESINLLAVSGLSRVDSRRTCTMQVTAAMLEVASKGALTQYLSPADADALPAHHQLNQADEGCAIYGMLHQSPDKKSGIVVLLEQRKCAKKPINITLLSKDMAPSLVLLSMMHRSSRSFVRKLQDEATAIASSFKNKQYFDKHLLVFVCSVLAITAMLLPVPHRVTVRAAIEASDRQVLVAPQKGYVLSSHARAGDTVKEGALLATLDGEDLQLVADKWRGEKLKNEQEYSQALATHDRVSLSRLRADAVRIDAELALADQQLQRSELRAPFDGVLLSGDLSQSLGSPVEEGQVLFEIGSKDAYRLQMDIDEHDIAFIQQGQEARIRMTALPGVTWEATLENVLPVAIAEQGESIFRVPAEIVGDAEALRPGMAGIGKIQVGYRSLAWVVTHAVTDRLRIGLWKLGLIQ